MMFLFYSYMASSYTSTFTKGMGEKPSSPVKAPYPLQDDTYLDNPLRKC